MNPNVAPVSCCSHLKISPDREKIKEAFPALPGGGSLLRFGGVSEAEALLDTCKQVKSEPEKSGETDSELQKWEERRKKAVKVASAFRRVGLERRGMKMDSCGRGYHRAVCRSCGKAQNVTEAYHCGDRLCPVCASRRSARMSGRWDRAIKAFQAENPSHAYFLTVTFADSEELKPFANYTNPRRMLLRHPWWRQYGLIGSVSAFETKLGKGSGRWHSHFHMVLFTRYPVPLIETGEHAGEFQNTVNQEISDLWRELTGGESYIVKGVQFDGNTKELVKYMSKSPDRLPDEKLLELATWSKGKRFLSTSGKCYNNPVMREAMTDGEEEYGLRPCPTCGGTEFELHSYSWSDRHQRYMLSGVRDVKATESSGDG